MPKREKAHEWAVEFGRIFRELREQRRWNLRTGAEHVHLSSSFLSLLEQGANMPSIDTLRWFGSVYGVAASELLRRVERTMWERQAGATAKSVPPQHRANDSPAPPAAAEKKPDRGIPTRRQELFNQLARARQKRKSR